MQELTWNIIGQSTPGPDLKLWVFFAPMVFYCVKLIGFRKMMCQSCLNVSRISSVYWGGDYENLASGSRVTDYVVNSGAPKEMIKDLLGPEAPVSEVQADVVVIGAGVAGLMLASSLNRRGVRVIVLESGGRSQQSSFHPLNEVILDSHRYGGAQKGRARCIGGTSTRWGGAMLPMLACDMGPHTAGWDVEWPVQLAEVERYFDDIERIFNLPRGGFEWPELESGDILKAGFKFLGAKWPSFWRRNLAHLYADDIEGPNLQIWINATVARFELDNRSRLRAVEAVSGSGMRIRAAAPLFALAAGAIESTRLLLILNRQYDDRIFSADCPLGRHFHDHLSTVAAEIRPTSRVKLNETFGLHFVGGSMRDVRLVPREYLRRAGKMPGGFAHLASITSGKDGFSALRSIHRSLQSGSLPQMRDYVQLAMDSGWFLRAAWWFFAKRRLLAPSGTRNHLCLVVEQEPHTDNRIRLSSDQQDALGMPLVKLDWQVREQDIANFAALQSALQTCWESSWLRRLGEFIPTPKHQWVARLRDGGDVYHPGGTTRMGRDRLSGVVNANLRTFDVPNLYVVSTSAFPSGGSANPSFVLMAFALRAAEHIAAVSRENHIDQGRVLEIR